MKKNHKKIDHNKPLPDHTRLDYDECCAKLILEELFPNQYCDLTLDDCPDLQGKDMGIEVTLSDYSDRQEAYSNWVKALNTDGIYREKHIERLAQLNVTFTGGIQTMPYPDKTFDTTRKTIEAKIHKLKSGNYKTFERYELFIFTDTWFSEEVLKEAFVYIFDGESGKCFETIYVLSRGLTLHIFESSKRKYRSIDIDPSEQTRRNLRAREMVEKAEEEQ